MFFFVSLLLQCKFANSTLLSLVSFTYFITPYDAQASSAFSALIYVGWSGRPGWEGRGYNCSDFPFASFEHKNFQNTKNFAPWGETFFL